MKTTTLDQCAETMGAEAPKLVKKNVGKESISVEEAVMLARSSYSPVKGLPITPLEAAMNGQKFTVQNADGTQTTYNPHGEVAPRLKNDDSVMAMPNESQADSLLDFYIRGVTANEGSFDVEKVWQYAKLNPDNPLSYEFVKTKGTAKLETLVANGAIKLVNPIEKVYAR